MKGCAAIVHAGPALGARFTQYTAEFEAGGELGGTPAQRFIFVMEGAVKLEANGKQTMLGATATPMCRKASGIVLRRARKAARQ
jgi:(S)-ureidoglycine aminohydrolase